MKFIKLFLQIIIIVFVDITHVISPAMTERHYVTLFHHPGRETGGQGAAA